MCGSLGSSKALQDAGTGLLLGTDEGTMGIVSGCAIPWELAALVRAGLTPDQALATETRNFAAFLQALDETGTVAVGKRADSVLLNGNPLRDIRTTGQPAGVLLGGRWLPREELDCAAGSTLPSHRSRTSSQRIWPSA
jgi:imidazolonepropionase-like amidohydrolase